MYTYVFNVHVLIVLGVMADKWSEVLKLIKLYKNLLSTGILGGWKMGNARVRGWNRGR